jgi:hypothetical protein
MATSRVENSDQVLPLASALAYLMAVLYGFIDLFKTPQHISFLSNYKVPFNSISATTFVIMTHVITTPSNNTRKHDNTQHNDRQHNNTWHDNTQHNSIQENNTYSAKRHSKQQTQNYNS